MPPITRDDIVCVLTDYAWSLDSTRPDDFAETFAPDGVLDGPTGSFHGAAELASFAADARLVDCGWQHWTNNVRFEQTSETEAISQCYVTVVDIRSEPPRIVAAGTYFDELVWADGRWRFRSRRWGRRPSAVEPF